jgi:hypothetical protein
MTDFQWSDAIHSQAVSTKEKGREPNDYLRKQLSIA